MRNSQNHPLRIDELHCRPNAPGVLGLTFCPGKRGGSVFGSAWSRDLPLDLEAIARWGAVSVLTLMETHELHALGVPQLSDAVRALGLRWHHCPIVDMQAPGPEFREIAVQPLRQALAALHAGGKVLVHCRGGLGRTGVVAASLLIELGEDPACALRRVRQARPGTVETPSQERYVMRYQRWLHD